MFVYSGVDTFWNPEPRAKIAGPVIDRMTDLVPALPDDRVQLVRANAAAQVIAGSLLAVGRLPRLSAAVLAASLVPTTVAGHRFWEMDDPKQIVQQRTHFLKNSAILGGLMAFATRRTRREPKH